MKRKFLAGVLALCMLFSILPGAAFAAPEQLDAPTGLQWDLANSIVKWNSTTNGEETYDIKFYKDGELYVLPGGWESEMYGVMGNTQSIHSFIFESGSYTFSVKSVGDGITYTDSDVAVSEAFVYTRPAAELDAPLTLQWEDTSFCWSPVENAKAYVLYIYMDGDLMGTVEGLKPSKTTAEGLYKFNDDDFILHLANNFYGAGECSFKVQAISDDMTVTAYSPLSEMSSSKDILSILNGDSSQDNEVLQKLPTPTVEWLTEPKTIGNRNFDAGDVVLTDIPQNVLPNFEVTLLNTKGEVIEEFTDGFGGYTQIAKDIPVGWFMDTDLESGDYIMQVQYLGDDEKYSDSEVAETDVYTYIKPSQKYNTPTDVSWDNGDISVSNVQEDNEVFIQFFYSSNNRTGMSSVGARWGNGTAEYLERFNHLVNECGEGEYKFRARVMSESITEIYHSDWSEWSDVYTVTGDNVQSTLKDLNKQNGLSVDNALQAVRELNSNELMTALSADNNSTGVAKELAELEEKYNLTAEVELDAHAGFNFDSSMVSVVGAGLNAADPSETPVFTITKPLAEKALPDGYANDVQMDFNLSNAVKDSEGKLAVPIRITMPVPDGMNGQKLRILHYKDDNSIDVIEPHLYQDNHIWTVSFTVDSLSPFVFAEIASQNDPQGQLSAPTNLQWVNNKGEISWKAVAGAERYDVVVKKDGAVVRNMQCRDREGTGVCSVSIADMINQSGEYTFSVAAIGDGRSTYTQCPESFQYVRPSQELKAPTSVQWRDGFASWAPDTQTDEVSRYDVHFYKEQNHVSGHGYNGLVRADGYLYDILHYVDDIVDKFSGETDAKLTYSVQAISDDISTVANSPVVHSENTVKIGDYLGELSAPKGMEWHKDRNGEKTATLIFYPVANTYDYHVKLYRNDNLVHEADFSEGGFYTGGKMGVDLSSRMTAPGVYKAEVAALGNGNNTFDSDYTMCTETYERGEAIAAPTNVKWLDKSRGIIGWEGPENHGGFDLIVMRNGDTVGRMGFGSGTLPDGDGFYTAYTGNLINRSGDYTVSVRIWSYNDTLEDSDYVVSDVFEYTRPSTELTVPQNLQWRDNFATWEEIDDENLNSYAVYYQRNGSTVMYDTIAPLVVNERGYISHNKNSFTLNALLKNGNDDYTFTVQANSNDLLNVANSSSSVSSAALNEIAFRGSLDTPTGLAWSNDTFGLLEFYPVANTVNDQSRAYHIQLYHNDVKILDVDHGYGYHDANGKIWMYFGDLMNAAGEYKVKVRANGDAGYSDNSEYAVSAPLRKEVNTTAILENLNAQNNMTAGEAIAVVKGIDSEELMNAVSSDTNGTGAAKEIADLEKKYDLTATVEVKPNSGVSIDVNKVMIVGAGLNAKDVSEAPKLTITKLSTTKPLPKEYTKNVQLEFSLSNVVTDSKNNLGVPVQITLPVPDGINPQKFHILHYKSQGGMDVIEPHVFKEKNMWMARFTVNSFSPFVFAELAEKVQTTPMYRLYNPNSGEHFYTGSIEERDMLDRVGWNYEGVAWNAPTNSGDPVYRLFNPNSGDHHYTMSAEERDMLVDVGWSYEGVAWNSASNDNVPQYRLYNPNADCGSHHYTSSIEERDYLVSLGWILEGIGWFGMLN